MTAKEPVCTLHLFPFYGTSHNVLSKQQAPFLYSRCLKMLCDESNQEAMTKYQVVNDFVTEHDDPIAASKHLSLAKYSINKLVIYNVRNLISNKTCIAKQ